MRTVIQRVSSASCTIDGKVSGAIDQGYMILVGIQDADDEAIVEKMADKIVRLRINEDENGKMNLNLDAIGGSILSISQFTLYADCRKGNRPSFTGAGNPSHASRLYDYFNEYLRGLGVRVETGVFGADMKIALVNDGPVTIVLDSETLF